MKNKELFISDKPEYLGDKCPKCGSKKTYTTVGYIGYDAPNIQCKQCGGKWYTCPDYKLEVRKNVNESKVFKVNKFNTMLFEFIKWYCTKINITVTFTNRKLGAYSDPNHTLYVNGYVNGNGNICLKN